MAGIGAGAPFGITLDELRARLRAVEPNAVLVPARILRRVIKHDRKMTSLGLQVPHRKSYVLDAAAATAIMERDELGLDVDAEAALTGAGLPAGRARAPERLARMTAGQALLKYWRLLFHARVDRALDERRRAGALSTSAGPAGPDRPDRHGAASTRPAPCSGTRTTCCRPATSGRRTASSSPSTSSCGTSRPDCCRATSRRSTTRRRSTAVLAEDVDAERTLRPDPAAPGARPAGDRRADRRGRPLRRGPRARRDGRGGRHLPAALPGTPPPPGRAAGPPRRAAPAAAATSSGRRSSAPGPPGSSTRSAPRCRPSPGPGPASCSAGSASGWSEALGLTPAEADDWRCALPALLAPASRGDLGRRGPLAVRPPEALRRLRAADLHRRPRRVDADPRPAADQAAPAVPARAAGGQAPAVGPPTAPAGPDLGARPPPARHERIAEALQRAEVDPPRPLPAGDRRDPPRDRPRAAATSPERVSFDKIVEELLDKVVARPAS